MVILYTISDCFCCGGLPACDACDCLYLEVSGFANEDLSCGGGNPNMNCNTWNSTSRFEQSGTDCSTWACGVCTEDTCINTAFVVWSAGNSRWEMVFGFASCGAGGQSWYLPSVLETECPIGIWTYNTGGSCDMSSVVVETYKDTSDCACA